MPQKYPQNEPFVNLSVAQLAPESVIQYQTEERSLIASRVRVSHGRYNELMQVMREDVISSDDYIRRLAAQLSEHYSESGFEACVTMGDLVHKSITMLLKYSVPTTAPLFRPI